jgi:phosphoserine aminotransferase
MVHKDLIGNVQPIMPVMLDFKTLADNARSTTPRPASPSTYAASSLRTCSHTQGSLVEVEKKNTYKVGILYDTIDASGGYYTSADWRLGEKSVQSLINVSFTLARDQILRSNLSLRRPMQGGRGHGAAQRTHVNWWHTCVSHVHFTSYQKRC